MAPAMTNSRKTGALRPIVSAVAGMLVFCPLACRNSEPTPSFYKDLGDEDRPLPPPAPSWADPAVKDGTAEWRGFSLGKGASSSASSPSKGAAGPERTSADPKSKVEEAVRGFIDDYNDAVKDKDFAALPEFYVKGQRETVKTMMEIRESLLSKITALMAVLDEKSPGASAALKPKFDQFAAGKHMELSLESLTVVDEKEATGVIKAPEGGTVPEALLAARFVLVGEDWEVELAQVEALAAAAPTLTASVAQFDQVIEAVRSGAVPADMVVQQLDALFAAFQGAAPK